MKRRSLQVMLIMAMSVGCFFVAKWGGSRFLSAKAASASFVPYTMQCQTVLYDSGQPKLGEKRTIALKRDGTELWIGEWPGEEDKRLKKLIGNDGAVTTMIDSIKAKMSGFPSEDVATARSLRAQNAETHCRYPGETDGGSELLLGVETSISIQANSVVRSTVWRATDFGCASIKVRHEELVDGYWQLKAEMLPLVFRPGDPDEALFEVESTLDEVPPSEAVRRLSARDNVSMEECPDCLTPEKLDQLDRNYFEQKAPGSEQR